MQLSYESSDNQRCSILKLDKALRESLSAVRTQSPAAIAPIANFLAFQQLNMHQCDDPFPRTDSPDHT